MPVGCESSKTTLRKDTMITESWKRLSFYGLTALLLVPLSFTALGAQEKTPKPMKLKVGDMAPDFTLLSFDGKDLQKISLHDYRGKKDVALAFYVFAFTGG
jgi:hypothetical protein